MTDILFVGNASYDQIHDNNGLIFNCIGGSAINSALAALISKRNKLAIFSHIGSDFIPELLKLSGIDIQYILSSHAPTNKFYINETKRGIKLLTHGYLNVELNRNDIKTKHLHASIRNGVDANGFFAKVDYQSASADIMLSSLDEKIDDLKINLSKIKFLFCNREEFTMLTNKYLPSFTQYPDLTIIVTHKEGVKLMNIEKEVFVKNIQIDLERVQSTIGAGDVFIGAFLDYFLNFKNLLRAVCYGLSVATVSTTNYGVNHILLKQYEINEFFHLILKLNERTIT